MIRLHTASLAVLLLSSSVLVLLLPTGCSPAAHAAEPPAAQAEDIEPAVVTQFGERVLLFMEHPRLVRGDSARFLAHFSVLETGQPVRAGRVELSVGPTTLAVDAPMRDGLFTPEGPFPEAGVFPMSIIVTSDQVSERLELGEVTVHGDLAEARAAAEAEAADEPANAVPFLLEQQWKIGLLLTETGPSHLVERLTVPARVVAAEGATAVVSAPAAGLLLAPAVGAFPRSGERVQVGQELALIEPPLAAADAAQLRALDLQWQLEVLAVERSMVDAAARRRFAESEHSRLVDLRPDGLATQQQLDQAERDLALAEGEFASGQAAREALATLRDRRQRESWSGEGALRLRLLAPIDGEVVSSGRALGEALEAGASVFRVVDRSRLWIEGRVSEFDLPLLSNATGAMASFPGLPGRRVAVEALSPGTLLQRDPEVDPASHTLRLRAGLPDLAGDVHPGMLAELGIAVAEVDAAVVIPAEAIVLDQGLPTAYVMLSGETFQRRDLTLGLTDGDLVEVRTGLRAGERIATRGAATIRMAALSPSDFGQGHAH